MIDRPTTRRWTVLAAGLLAAAPAATAQLREAEIETRWVYDADAAHPGGTIRAALRVEIEEGFHVQSDKPADEYLVPTTLTVTPPPGVEVRHVVYPEAVLFEADYSEAPMPVFGHEFAIGVVLTVAEDVAPGTYPLPATLRYQACDDKYCLAPAEREIESTLRVVPASSTVTAANETLFAGIDFPDATSGAEEGDGAAAAAGPQDEAAPAPAAGPDCDVLAELDGFRILDTTGGYLGSDDFIAFIDAAESGAPQGNLLENKGPLAILLLVVIGGLALNLTPCVLPLIPINVAIIGAGAQAGSRARGFALGGTYGLAMALVYGGLGLAVTLTAASFGAINSTIWFNVAIAVLFVLLGLAMFDVIYIDFSKFQSKLDMTRTARRGTFALAFGMGAVSALLAGACVAPVVIQVIVYASDQYAKGTAIALALPFFLGVGMALPWPFAGAGLSLLPKPGKWMVRVKQGFGVFILAFAAYYGYVAWEIYDARRVDREVVASAVEAQLEEGWTDSICDGLATARAENRLVLIDMWATWCKNCLAMDKTTFADERVLARLEDYVKIKFQAEDLGASPNEEMLKRFEQFGLPAYAILKPRGAGDPEQLAATAAP